METGTAHRMENGVGYEDDERMPPRLLVGFLTMEVLHLEVSARGQAIGFQPIPAPFPSGTILDVTPAVSADRRYVRLSSTPASVF